MRAIRLILLVALGLTLTAGPASAGGPTSVLLTSPENQRAAALYNGDTAYIRLQSLLDTGRVVSGEPQYDGSYVNVTWLVHDVHIWRSDRVELDTDGGPVVETTTFMDPSGDPAVTRRKLDNPLEVTALLHTLGLTGPAPTTSPAAAPVVDVAQRTPLVTEATGDARWEWGIGGLVLGALAAALVARLRNVRAAR
ncbi:hypothetical protein ACTG9Q_11765 [Actinokineospora sp. 24-640]